MINKTTTLSVIIASILMTACAGNNIKQQESMNEKEKSTDTIEVTANSEIVLSDFPIEANTNSSELKADTSSSSTPDTTMAQYDTGLSAKDKSNQPKIKLVNFSFDKFDITDQNKDLLKQHAQFLLSNPNYTLAVNGHSDYRGPEVYNEKLSLRRANTVASLLISFGAPKSQLIINSFGASQPVEDYDNWFQNRRVELEYSELYMVSK